MPKCHQTVVTKNGNTSNLLTHLRVNHATLYEECRKAMEQKAKTTGAKESKKPQGCPSSSTQPTSQPTLLEAIEKS